MISRVTMLDGKNSLPRKKKERENDILRRIYLAQLVLFIRKGRGGKREREKGKNRALSDQKYTRRMKIQREQRIDEIKIPVQCD